MELRHFSAFSFPSCLIYRRADTKLIDGLDLQISGSAVIFFCACMCVFVINLKIMGDCLTV